MEREAEAFGVRLRYSSDFIELSKGNKDMRLGFGHEIYLPDCFEHFDYYFGAVKTLETGGRKLADFSTPRFHKVVGFDDFPILFPSVPEPYVALEQYLTFARLKQGDVVLDLGLYAGLTAMVFSRLVGPEGAVFGFEADSTNFAVTSENLETARRFGLPANTTIIPKAVWCNDDGLQFSMEAAMGSSAASIVGAGRGRLVKIPTTTLETFCRERCIDRVDFIKIDIEGAEVEVLESSRDLLSRLKPRVIVEAHEVRGAMVTDRCCEILAGAGYKTRIVEQQGYTLPLIEAVAR